MLNQNSWKNHILNRYRSKERSPYISERKKPVPLQFLCTKENKNYNLYTWLFIVKENKCLHYLSNIHNSCFFFFTIWNYHTQKPLLSGRERWFVRSVDRTINFPASSGHSRNSMKNLNLDISERNKQFRSHLWIVRVLDPVLIAFNPKLQDPKHRCAKNGLKLIWMQSLHSDRGKFPIVNMNVVGILNDFSWSAQKLLSQLSCTLFWSMFEIGEDNYKNSFTFGSPNETK